jgi:hypothetical protein
MPEPTAAESPPAARSAGAVGILRALAFVLVFAPAALANGESPSGELRGDPRGEPIANARPSAAGVATEGAAAAAPRPASPAASAPVAVAPADPDPPTVHADELRLFFVLLLVALALRPVAALMSAILRRRRERLN